MPENSYVGDELRLAAELYDQRNEVYGDTYKEFGDLLHALHPEGITLVTKEDFNRFGVYTQILSKIKRYSVNFMKGGHEDSLTDLAVYANMLKELDYEQKENK